MARVKDQSFGECWINFEGDDSKLLAANGAFFLVFTFISLFFPFLLPMGETYSTLCKGDKHSSSQAYGLVSPQVTSWTR